MITGKARQPRRPNTVRLPGLRVTADEHEQLRAWSDAANRSIPAVAHDRLFTPSPLQWRVLLDELAGLRTELARADVSWFDARLDRVERLLREARRDRQGPQRRP